MAGRSEDGLQPVELGFELGARAEGVVALEEDRPRAGAGEEGAQEVEGGRGDRVSVGIAPEGVDAGTAGDVEVGDAVEGQAGEEGRGVAAVVDEVGVEVGDVEQEVGAGAVEELGEEVGLGEVVVGPGERGGDVLEGERDGESIEGAADVVDEDGELGAGAGDGEEVAELGGAGAREGDVLADERERSARATAIATRRR